MIYSTKTHKDIFPNVIPGTSLPKHKTTVSYYFYNSQSIPNIYFYLIPCIAPSNLDVCKQKRMVLKTQEAFVFSKHLYVSYSKKIRPLAQSQIDKSTVCPLNIIQLLSETLFSILRFFFRHSNISNCTERTVLNIQCIISSTYSVAEKSLYLGSIFLTRIHSYIYTFQRHLRGIRY